LLRILPALMLLGYLAWPVLERGEPRRRLWASQALIAATIAFFVLTMLLFGFDPFA
jgi:hypothetical protein